MGDNAPACRSCGGTHLDVILSLGSMPLANSLLEEEALEKPERSYPLDLVFCPSCSLVQITETVPPEDLFREYLYFSSYSDTMLEHAREITGLLLQQRRLTGRSLVVELASNDGYLLQYFVQENIPVLGIEPALNIAKVAQSKGIPTVAEFFGEGLARALVAEGKRADVIIGTNVLAHVPDPNGFARGIRLLLKDDGIALIEVPYVKDMIDRCEFDTIYHEHLSYYSLTALVRLFERQGLTIKRVDRIPIHGGSLRIFVGPAASGGESPSVQSLLDEERRWGVDGLDFYRAFASRVAGLRASLLELLRTLKDGGKRIAAYGAAAKGTVLLNYCGVGGDLLDFVVDRSPYKQNRFVPGVHVPISGPERLIADRPDYVLILAWNLSREIIKQQAEYVRLGGRFIVPVPEPRIVREASA